MLWTTAAAVKAGLGGHIITKMKNTGLEEGKGRLNGSGRRGRMEMIMDNQVLNVERISVLLNTSLTFPNLKEDYDHNNSQSR